MGEPITDFTEPRAILTITLEPNMHRTTVVGSFRAERVTADETGIVDLRDPVHWGLIFAEAMENVVAMLQQEGDTRSRTDILTEMFNAMMRLSE